MQRSRIASAARIRSTTSRKFSNDGPITTGTPNCAGSSGLCPPLAPGFPRQTRPLANPVHRRQIPNRIQQKNRSAGDRPCRSRNQLRRTEPMPYSFISRVSRLKPLRMPRSHHDHCLRNCLQYRRPALPASLFLALDCFHGTTCHHQRPVAYRLADKRLPPGSASALSRRTSNSPSPAPAPRGAHLRSTAARPLHSAQETAKSSQQSAAIAAAAAYTAGNERSQTRAFTTATGTLRVAHSPAFAAKARSPSKPASSAAAPCRYAPAPPNRKIQRTDKTPALRANRSLAKPAPSPSSSTPANSPSRPEPPPTPRTSRVAATTSPTETACTQTTSRPATAARNPSGTTPSRPASPARYRPLVAIRSSQYGAPRTRAASNSELYTIITVAFPRFTLCASEDDNQLGHEVPPIPSDSAST